MIKVGYVYILTNKKKSTLYIGVTYDLCKRIFEHKRKIYNNSFTAKYNLEYCIYIEVYSEITSAIKREKELKKWNRKKKNLLIETLNPNWETLATEFGFNCNLKITPSKIS